jgi:putative SOS response-associated peptidase YedK
MLLARLGIWRGLAIPEGLKGQIIFGLPFAFLRFGQTGYYEWRAAGGGKQPYFISAADGAVLSIAGLWDQWKDPLTGETISSCTLIVTGANDFTRSVHDRMPVLLEHRDLDFWLTGKAGAELLRPAPNDLLRIWPVSTRVNATGRGDDDPSLVERVQCVE